MKSYLRIFSYIVIIGTIQPLKSCWGGCTKCESQTFSDDIRRYFFNYKPGSYWIYKNTLNNDVDSIYFVSQSISKKTVGERPDCFTESGLFALKGFANNRSFGVIFGTNKPEVSLTVGSDIDFYGEIVQGEKETLNVNGETYTDVLNMKNCCVENKCPSAYSCNTNYFEMMKISFVKDVGIVRWQARYHPIYGNVVYDLVRYRILQ